MFFKKLPPPPPPRKPMVALFTVHLREGRTLHSEVAYNGARGYCKPSIEAYNGVVQAGALVVNLDEFAFATVEYKETLT